MKRTFLVSFLLVATVGCFAQQNSKMLSFDEALTKTLNDNPQIKAIEYEQSAADQTRKSVSGLRLPNVSMGATYAHLGKDIAFDVNDLKTPIQSLSTGLFGSLMQQGIQIPAEVLSGASSLFAQNWGMTLQDRDVAFAGVTATMPLYMGGKINAANRAAEIDRRTTLKQGEQSRNQLLSQLVERYYGLVLANQVVKVRQQVVDGMQVHLDNAIRLEETGIIAKGERLYAEYKMADAKRELTSSQMQVKTVSAALSSMFAESGGYVPVSTMFVLSDIEPLEYYTDAALNDNPLLAQVDLKHSLAKEGVKVEAAGFKPQVAAMGGASFYDYQLSDALPRWVVGAGVTLNIFDGLSREHKYSAAKNKVRQVEALKSKAENDIAVLVESLYNQLCDYASQIPSIDTSIKFAEEYLRVKEVAFQEGMATSADVVDARLNLAKVKTERLSAAYNYDLTLAKLLEAVGRSDEFSDYVRSGKASRITFE